MGTTTPTLHLEEIAQGRGFPGGSEVKAFSWNVGDLGSIPGLGRSPGEGNGNPLQYSWLENPIEGGAWWATVHGVTKSWTRLSDFTFTFLSYNKRETKARCEPCLSRKLPSEKWKKVILKQLFNAAYSMPFKFLVILTDYTQCIQRETSRLPFAFSRLSVKCVGDRILKVSLLCWWKSKETNY